MGCGRETPIPTLIFLNFLLWFAVINSMAFQHARDQENAYWIQNNFERQLDSYWTTRRGTNYSVINKGLHQVQSIPDLQNYINQVYIPNFVNYNTTDNRTRLVTDYDKYSWPGVTLQDNSYTRLGSIFVFQQLMESALSTSLQETPITYSDQSGQSATQDFSDADGYTSVSSYVFPKAGYFWEWNPNITAVDATAQVNSVLFNASSGWNDEARTKVIRLYGVFLNNNYFFDGTVTFYFKETGGIEASSSAQLFLSVQPTVFLLFTISGAISLLYLIYQIFSLRSLFPEKPIRFLDLVIGLVWLVAVGAYAQVQSNVDLLDCKDFAAWEDAPFSIDLLGDAELPFPQRQLLSRTLTSSDLAQVMWIWRSMLGGLLLLTYLKFLNVISSVVPLTSFPTDVVAAGGASMWVFCMTTGIIMVGFVQMFVAQYYLYVPNVREFGHGLLFLFMNLVGNTNVNAFSLPLATIDGEGRLMLAVFLFAMIYILFTMFVAIIATNYRLIYKQIEATPTIDLEPIKQRCKVLFCDYPMMCKAMGPVGFVRWHFTAGKMTSDEEDTPAAPEAFEDGAPAADDEDGGDLKIEESEEVGEVELLRRSAESRFFDNFTELHEKMSVLKTHFEVVMGRLELLDNLQDVVAQVQVRQENLDEALQLHNEEVEKIIGAAKEPRQATINH